MTRGCINSFSPEPTHPLHHRLQPPEMVHMTVGQNQCFHSRQIHIKRIGILGRAMGGKPEIKQQLTHLAGRCDTDQSGESMFGQNTVFDL